MNDKKIEKDSPVERITTGPAKIDIITVPEDKIHNQLVVDMNRKKTPQPKSKQKNKKSNK
jgi:hypothetical protein